MGQGSLPLPRPLSFVPDHEGHPSESRPRSADLQLQLRLRALGTLLGGSAVSAGRRGGALAQPGLQRVVLHRPSQLQRLPPLLRGLQTHSRQPDGDRRRGDRANLDDLARPQWPTSSYACRSLFEGESRSETKTGAGSGTERPSDEAVETGHGRGSADGGNEARSPEELLQASGDARETSQEPSPLAQSGHRSSTADQILASGARFKYFELF